MRSCTVFLGVQSEAEVMRPGKLRLRWFWHLEPKINGCWPVKM